MGRQVYADNVDANGKVFDTVGENIRKGARAGELLNYEEILEKIDALDPKISSLQADVTENKSGIKKNSDDIDLLNEDIAKSKKAIADLNDKKITKFYANSLGETTLNDSDNGKIHDMILYGKSKQKQYSGKNLLNPSVLLGTYNGITCTIDDNGYININGTTSVKIIKEIQNINDETMYCYANITEFPTELYLYKPTASSLIKADFFTLQANEGIQFTINKGVTINNFKLKIMFSTTRISGFEEPYVGGIPSPNHDYPQEIKSVVNPVVTVSNSDETNSVTATLPYTLNAIPVSEGGNVTIDGQQYIADYVDIEKKKIHRLVDSSKLDPTVSIVDNTDWLLSVEEVIYLTDEEVQAFKELATYYPTTNVMVTSDQLDGYTTFNYPISMENGWNLIKEQLGDTREYIYDMELQSAEAYVNSEYAVTLTELGV